MAWTANATSKSFVNGVYVVDLEYTDGVSVVQDTYRSSIPNLNELKTIVRNRLVNLEDAAVFDVVLGTITPADPTISDDFTLFLNRLRLMSQIKDLIDLGIVPAGNSKIIALGSWITSNFSTYIDRL